jgi:modulator of FtsH protease HflC
MNEQLQRRLRIAGAIAVGAVLLWTAFVVVPETELVILTRFGKPTRVLRDAGFYVKWPIERAMRFDRRVAVYNPRPSEFLTRDKKNLVVDSAVCWRVADPLQFLETVGDQVGAELRLHDIVWAALAAEIGQVQLDDLVTVDPEHVKVAAVVAGVRDKAASVSRDRLGIEVVDVQLKRVTFPEQNKQSVFARMRAERDRIAKEYRAQGREMAIGIQAQADKEREVILATAYEQAEKLRGQGDAEATRIYGEAYSRDPKFYRFLRTLESYKKVLDEKTTIILSADSELLRLLEKGQP